MKLDSIFQDYQYVLFICLLNCVCRLILDILQRTTKLTKQQKDQYSLAQRDPAAFFEELKKRLLAYQAENSTAAKLRGLTQSFNIPTKNSLFPIDSRMNLDDSSAVLESQIAKTIDEADNSLFESPTKLTYRYPIRYSNHSLMTNSFTRSDSGVGTDTSEK